MSDSARLSVELLSVGAAGAASGEATETVADRVDSCVSGPASDPSVTWSSNEYVAPAVNVPPAIEQVSVAPAAAPEPPFWAHVVAATAAIPLTETSHCHEYGAVPVDGIVPVTVSVWSASSAVALTVGAAGAVSAELTATLDDGEENAVSEVVAESVTSSSNV